MLVGVFAIIDRLLRRPHREGFAGFQSADRGLDSGL